MVLGTKYVLHKCQLLLSMIKGLQGHDSFTATGEKSQTGHRAHLVGTSKSVSRLPTGTTDAGHTGFLTLGDAPFSVMAATDIILISQQAQQSHVNCLGSHSSLVTEQGPPRLELFLLYVPPQLGPRRPVTCLH